MSFVPPVLSFIPFASAMTPPDFDAALDVFRSSDNFALIAHFRPDGDAIGSTIALGLTLRAMGKKVRLFNEDTVPERYRFLEGSEDILPTPAEPVDADVVVSLDNGAWKRLGDRSMNALSGVPLIVNIDHHGTNERFGAVNCIMPGEAATACILYRMIARLGVPMTPAVSRALYAAISTDTGSFQYEKTTPEVMRMAADLIEHGVDVMEMNRLLYQEVSYKSLLVTREVLNGMCLEEGGDICSYALDRETKERLGTEPDDVADLVDVIRVIRGVRVAAIFEEMDDGRVRVSMRSKDPRVDVSAIAAQFGGGGHPLAAGIRMPGPLSEARERVLKAIRVACRAANV